MTTSLVVGGGGGLGQYIAERLAGRGDDVIITSRTPTRAQEVAAELGPRARGLAVDLARPSTIADDLVDIDEVDNLVLTAFAPSPNTLHGFDITDAIAAITIKLVGYTEVVRSLHSRLGDGAAVVLFGGMAKDRPYPGSTMVTAHNSGISGLVKTLAVEIAPHRVNALHPGLVGDSPRWRDVPDHPAVGRTPTKRLVTMADVADATEFLLRNPGINAHDLALDGGMIVS
jgi:NAD(P)-dependent dehydrogenase (short-subunit alcohol dehydrogenase family)